MVLSPPYCWTLLHPVGFAFDSTTSSVLYCEFSLECIQKNMTSSKVRWERSLQPDRTLQLGWTHRLVVKWRGEDVILVCNTQIWVYCSLPKLSVYFDLQNFFFFFPFIAAEIGSVLRKVEVKTNNVACMVWGIAGALKHLCAELLLQSDLSEWLEPFFGKKKKSLLKMLVAHICCWSTSAVCIRRTFTRTKRQDVHEKIVTQAKNNYCVLKLAEEQVLDKCIWQTDPVWSL